MARKIAFLHTSPAAIQPIAGFFSETAPDFELTNLLDDGLLRFFAAGDETRIKDRLLEMVRTATEVYGAEVVTLTCSAVSRSTLTCLRDRSPRPLLKIDEPMVRQAAASGTRIGVALTFPPTLEPTRRALIEAAEEAGRSVDVIAEAIPDAYQALLAGEREIHDRLVLAGISRLIASKVDVIVLAQLSMARVRSTAQAMTSILVLSSLDSALQEIRDAMELSR